MRKAVAVASVAAGILIVAVPWLVFPPCGHAGATHCGDTARAETILGAMLAVSGIAALAARRPAAVAGHAAVSVALLAAAFLAPSHYGYCPSPQMACHYGMVPAVRLVAAVAAAVLVAAGASLAGAARRSGGTA